MELRGIPVFLLISWLVEVSGLIRVCYFTNWAQHRPGAGKFTPDNIDPYLCSHIVYAYAWLSGNHLTATQDNDEPSPGDIGQYAKVTQLKELNPELKVLLAVGGWNAGSLHFSNMAAFNESRREFIQSAISYLRNHDFDGIDLDWEYPGRRRGRSTDRDNLNSLLIEMRLGFEEEANVTGSDVLLITAVVPPDKSFTETGYDVPVVSRMLDFLHVMTYDFHGSWESRVGHPSPMYPRPGEVGDDSLLNMESALNYWIQLGVPKKKLVASIALYGRTYTLLDSANHTVGSLDNGSGPAAPYTREPGFIAYYEICDLLNRGATRYWHADYKVPYLVNGTTWIGYDDPDSIALKMRRLKDLNIGGVMVWALDLDDFSGTFCNQGVSPLLTTVNLKLVDRKFNIENIPMGISAKHVNVSVTNFIDDVLRNQSDSKHSVRVPSQLTTHVPESVKQVADMIINAQAALEQSRGNTQKHRTDMLSEAKRVLLEKTGIWSGLKAGAPWKDTVAVPTGTILGTVSHTPNQQNAKAQVQFSHVPTNVISESVVMTSRSDKRDPASSVITIPSADKASLTLNVLKQKTATFTGNGNKQHSRTVSSNILNEQLKINPRKTNLQPVGVASFSDQNSFHRNKFVEHKSIDEVSLLLSNIFDGSYSAESIRRTGNKVHQTGYEQALDSINITAPNATAIQYGMDGNSGKGDVFDATSIKQINNTPPLSSRNTIGNARIEISTFGKETGNVEPRAQASKIGVSAQFKKTYYNSSNPTIRDALNIQPNDSLIPHGTDTKQYASDKTVIIRPLSDSSLSSRDIRAKTVIKDANKAGTLRIQTMNKPVTSIPNVGNFYEKQHSTNSSDVSSTQLDNSISMSTKAHESRVYSDGLKMPSASTFDATHIVKTSPRRAKLRVFEKVKSGVYAPRLVQTVMPDIEQSNIINTVDTSPSEGISIKTKATGEHVDALMNSDLFRGESKSVRTLEDTQPGEVTPGLHTNSLVSDGYLIRNRQNVNTFMDGQPTGISITYNAPIEYSNTQVNNNTIKRNIDNVESLQNAQAAGFFKVIKADTTGRIDNKRVSKDIPTENSRSFNAVHSIAPVGIPVKSYTIGRNSNTVVTNEIPTGNTQKDYILQTKSSARLSIEGNTQGRNPITVANHDILTENNQSGDIMKGILPARVYVEANTLVRNSNAPLVNSDIHTGSNRSAKTRQIITSTGISIANKMPIMNENKLVNKDAGNSPGPNTQHIISKVGFSIDGNTQGRSVNTVVNNDILSGSRKHTNIPQGELSGGISIDGYTPEINSNTLVNDDILPGKSSRTKFQSTNISHSISSAGLPIKTHTPVVNANTQVSNDNFTGNSPNTNIPQSKSPVRDSVEVNTSGGIVNALVNNDIQISSTGISLEADTPETYVNTLVNNDLLSSNSLKSKLIQSISSAGVSGEENMLRRNANTIVNNNIPTGNSQSANIQQSISQTRKSIKANTPTENANGQMHKYFLTEKSPGTNSPHGSLSIGTSVDSITPGRNMNLLINNANILAENSPSANIEQKMPTAGLYIDGYKSGENANAPVSNDIYTGASTSADIPKNMLPAVISIATNTPERDVNTLMNNNVLTRNSPSANIPQSISSSAVFIDANILGNFANTQVNNDVPIGRSNNVSQTISPAEVSNNASMTGGYTDARVDKTLHKTSYTNTNNLVSSALPITSQDIIIDFNIYRAKGRKLSKMNKLDEKQTSPLDSNVKLAETYDKVTTTAQKNNVKPVKHGVNQARYLDSNVKLAETFDKVTTTAQKNNVKPVNETKIEVNTNNRNLTKDVPPGYHTGLKLKSKATIDSYRIIKVSPRRAKLRLRERVRAGVFAPTITQLDRQGQLQQRDYNLNVLGIKI